MLHVPSMEGLGGTSALDAWSGRGYDSWTFAAPMGERMTRYVIEPEIALTLAKNEAEIPPQHRLLAPTLLRSQVLAQLFVEVQRGDLSREEADRRLDYLRRLGVRLLGDRVLQRVAWRVALELGWQDTFVA